MTMPETSENLGACVEHRESPFSSSALLFYPAWIYISCGLGAAINVKTFCSIIIKSIHF